VSTPISRARGAYWAGRRARAQALIGYGFVLLLIATARLLTLDLHDSLTATPDERFAIAGLVLTNWSWMFAAGAAAWLWVAMTEQRAPSVWKGLGAPLAAVLGLGVLAVAAHLTRSEPAALGVYWGAAGLLATWAGARSSRIVWTVCAGLLLLGATAAAAYSATQMLERFGPGAPILGLRLTWWSAAALAIAGAWFAYALLIPPAIRRTSLVANDGERGLDLSVITLPGAVCLLGAAWHPEAFRPALALVWLALSTALFLAHRLAARLRLDAVGALAALAPIGAWYFAYVQTGWTGARAPALLHPGLGLALLIAGVLIAMGATLLRRTRTNINDPRHAIGGLACVAGAALTFLATSLEAGRIAEMLFPNDPTSRAGVLSIWWGLFGVGLVALGFLQRIPATRYVGLALVATAVGKALLFDLANVSAGWRVASFVGLGLLMLAVGVGYLKVAGGGGRRDLTPPREG